MTTNRTGRAFCQRARIAALLWLATLFERFSQWLVRKPDVAEAHARVVVSRVIASMRAGDRCACSACGEKREAVARATLRCGWCEGDVEGEFCVECANSVDVHAWGKRQHVRCAMAAHDGVRGAA